jgi:sporulation protein YlmC with PRC-barrel domain
MDDPGRPISYLALEPGTPVYASDGRRVGEVQHVLADPDADVFDGIVIDISPLPGGLRFADAPQVEELYERAVRLNVDSQEAARLPEPSENPPALRADPDDVAESELQRKLRRAWDLITGNY